MSEPATTNQRRLLLVSYWYPPAIGAAAERVFGFARHLPAFGWDAVVWTSGDPSRGGGKNVLRVADPRAGILRRGGEQFADYDARPPMGLISRFKLTMRRAMRDLLFPDRFRAWADAVQIEGDTANGFDAIMASFPPGSAILAGLKLHQRLGIPLILDFRDRWFGPGGYAPRSRRARDAHQKLESDAVRAARGIVVVSEAMADAVAREHTVERECIAVVPNGYEPEEDGAPLIGPVQASPLVIAHVGTVIARNRPDLFLNALAQNKAGGRLSDVVFRFVGNLSREYIQSLGLDGVVESTGLVSRESALREMQGAGALLLLVGDYVGRWGQNAKLFEYLRTGRPIICLEETPGSNDRRLLERLAADRSFFAPIDDADAIVRAIGEARSYLIRGIPPSRLSPEILRYSRRNLAGELAGRLNTWLST